MAVQMGTRRTLFPRYRIDRSRGVRNSVEKRGAGIVQPVEGRDRLRPSVGMTVNGVMPEDAPTQTTVLVPYA